MGLGIVVGMLADAAESDPEGVEDYRECFADLNEFLAKNELPLHAEPEVLPTLDNRCSLSSFPYSFLHHLRRIYAHKVADPSWTVRPIAEGERASADSVLKAQTAKRNSHLLCHSDAEGLYLPIDFQPVLFGEGAQIPGVMIGSSYRLMDEPLFLAPALSIQLQRRDLPDGEAEAINSESEIAQSLWIERIVWLSLFEAARLSIKHKAAIWFS